MLAQPIASSGPAAVARSNALADWARAEITRQRGPRPTIVRCANTLTATAAQREAYIDAFAAEMRSRDAAAAWDRALMALIRLAEAGEV